jgi:GMP reductase
VEFGGRRFKLPVVPANMKTVVDEPITAVAGRQRLLLRDAPLRPGQRGLREADARQGPVRVDQLGREAGRLPGDRPPRAEGVGAYITIDIAHGHAESVRRMIAYIKEKLPRPS